MRLFIAVDLSEPMKKSLVNVMHEMKKQGINASYIPKQNLHMTLAFIGETNKADEIRQIMDRIPIEKSRLAFSGYGYFGDRMWIGIKGNQKMKKYAADLRKELSAAGIPCDMKKFEPHVTLLRNLKGKHPADLPVPSEDMTFAKVSLMKSEMKDGKRVYQEIYAVQA